MFERNTLQYMVFKTIPSTAKIYEGMKANSSVKVELVGFVEAVNSIQACYEAIKIYGLDEDDFPLLRACLIEVFDKSEVFYEPDEVTEKELNGKFKFKDEPSYTFYIHRASNKKNRGPSPFSLHPKNIISELNDNRE
tara:strand:+ start:3467 stop:3877 length:411 start_codon:yes stop_codon:yes gene_type:complete